MSRTSELEICIGELRNAAQSLTAVADSLTMLFSGGNTETDTKTPVPAAQPKPEPSPITLEQVRTVLAEKSRDGHTAEVRELLEAHGATKLSAIDPKEYPALLAEGSQIGQSEGEANG